LRISKLHWAFPPIIGGVETHLMMLGPELVARGLTVNLLTGSVDGRETIDYQGMTVTRTPLMDLNGLGSPAGIQELAQNIRDELTAFVKKTRPDLIHVHNMHYFSPVHARVLARISRRENIPLVLTAHNVWDDELWCEMLSFRPVWDAVIAVSRFIKRELVKNGFQASRVHVVHHGMDLERFTPVGAAEREGILGRHPALRGRRVMFHPARMSLAKGSDFAVRAFAEMKKKLPDLCLVMAGTEKTVDWGSYQGPEIRKINALISSLKLADDVYIRFFPWDEIADMYRVADVVVYPSVFEEPFGLVMLEALASGIPIVVTESGGMPEVIEDGFNGFVVPRRDPHALAQRCLLILDDPVVAARLAANGLRRARERFSLPAMIDNTLDVYRRVVADRERAVTSGELVLGAHA
jgi:glycosyltransferase involved in cell wall biosynthesis